MEEIKAMDLESKDLVAERIEQMKALFPEIAVEGEGSIDFEKLRLILGDEAEEGDERYAFTWPGKADAIRQSQTVSNATLRPRPEESVDWDTTQNLYIEGDNLEVLKLLQRGYHGKIKMIYIDPPYNTGKDFVYKDNFSEPISNYREQAGLSGQSNADTSGSFHANWCSMIYPRIKLARELLSDDGVIFVSIDDNEQRNLRFICDEVFGEENFLGCFVWQKRTSPDMRRIVSSAHEYVLLYARNAKNRDCVNQIPYSEEDLGRYKNPDNDPNGPWISTDCTAQAGHGTPAQFYDMVTPAGRVVTLGSGLCWRYTQEKMQEEISAGHIWFGADGNGVPRKKTYLKDMSGKNAWTWLPNTEVGHTQEATKELKALFNGYQPFDFPKPTRLLNRLIQIGSNTDCIVLDFFSGSAAFADAVMQQNARDGGSRKYILVQLPEATDGKFENLCKVGEQRIRYAIEKIKAELEESNMQLKLGEDPKVLPDMGFRVMTLDDSGIIQPEPGQLLLERVKDDRSDQDIIFEMMLKWGLELTYPIEKIDIGGYECYSVAGDALICCMKPGLTVQTLNEIAELEPDRVLMLDSILDDTLKLNALQIFKRVEERTQKKIDLRTV